MRHIASFVILLIIAVPAVAQEPEPLPVLKQTLDLSESQIESLLQLLQARQAAMAPLVSEMQELQQRIGQHDQAFRAAFREMLTPAQRERLDAIEGLRAAVRASEALRLLGL